MQAGARKRGTVREGRREVPAAGKNVLSSCGGSAKVEGLINQHLCVPQIPIHHDHRLLFLAPAPFPDLPRYAGVPGC